MIVKSAGDDTLENMRIVSLEKDPEIVNDDEAVQVMRINENGDAVEVALGEDDDDEQDGSLIMLSEEIDWDEVIEKGLRNSKNNSNG